MPFFTPVTELEPSLKTQYGVSLHPTVRSMGALDYIDELILMSHRGYCHLAIAVYGGAPKNAG